MLVFLKFTAFQLQSEMKPPLVTLHSVCLDGLIIATLSTIILGCLFFLCECELAH